jgi:hypothetical protein
MSQIPLLPMDAYVPHLRRLPLLNIFTRIPFRRIKVMDDPTTVVCESEEYFNSDDIIDVTRLNIAKPGELFEVCLGFIPLLLS